MRHNPLSLFVLGGIAVTVWHGAYTKADDARPGQEQVRAGAPQTLIKPSSGTRQSATPRAVCTFASIGLYWTPDGGAEDKPCRVRYRPIAEPTWREALPLWFDKRIGEYRGSIVQLQSGTTYDVRLELPGGGPSTELRAATWSEAFPIARTVPVDDMTGTTIPNFNDGFHGRASDMGVCEAGAAPLQFGVNAYRAHESAGRQSK